MATVVLAPHALADVERLLEALRGTADGVGSRAALAIRTALAGLANHPLAGQPVGGELRLLRISSGSIGTVAAYRYLVPDDEVRVLAVRHQRELGIAP
jgi:plasmid stabilization system protein ParE